MSSARSDFEGRTALVTGASEGIGRATALAFAKAGANLVVCARNADRLKTLQDECETLGVHCKTVALDLSQRGTAQKLFQHIDDLDFVINNAGTEGAIKNIEDITAADYDQTFELNVRAVFEITSLSVERMKSSNRDCAIVNVSSIAGLRGFGKSSLYCASKFAVVGLTKSVAEELSGSRLRVNAVCPGPTDTAMFDRVMSAQGDSFKPQSVGGLRVDPSSVADTILFLCSSRSRDVRGQALVVNGSGL